MINWLLVGECQSGKSRSAREGIIPSWRDPGRFGLRRPARHVVVFDPQMKPGWGATALTKDLAEWVGWMNGSRSIVGVCDEAGATLEADPRLIQLLGPLALQNGNYGNLIYFIAQRANQLPIGIRNTCGSAYVFHQRAKYDRLWLADAYGEEMLTANTLDVGECLIGQPMKRPVKTRFFSIK